MDVIIIVSQKVVREKKNECKNYNSPRTLLGPITALGYYHSP